MSGNIITNIFANPIRTTGNGQVWKDIFFPLVPKITGVGSPAYATLVGNIQQLAFAVNDAIQLESVEHGHEFKQFGPGYFHIHWISMTDVAATRGVKWEIEYCRADVGDSFLTITDTKSAEASIPANTPAGTHFLTSIFTLGSMGKIAGHACVRLKRIAAVDTAPAANPMAIGVHYHALVDSEGSPAITSKF